MLVCKFRPACKFDNSMSSSSSLSYRSSASSLTDMSPRLTLFSPHCSAHYHHHHHPEWKRSEFHSELLRVKSLWLLLWSPVWVIPILLRAWDQKITQLELSLRLQIEDTNSKERTSLYSSSIDISTYLFFIELTWTQGHEGCWDQLREKGRQYFLSLFILWNRKTKRFVYYTFV